MVLLQGIVESVVGLVGEGGSSILPTLMKAVLFMLALNFPFESGSFFFQHVLSLKMATAQRQSSMQVSLQSCSS
ncbi:hypothetical protein Syun_002214 [Stephania yunnanensis]|uniref:Uncharacterized protein n=1 Tax=Stephania yunnanensis TaxID=152371 RepID=A0AAP0LL21_9MAGN